MQTNLKHYKIGIIGSEQWLLDLFVALSCALALAKVNYTNLFKHREIR